MFTRRFCFTVGNWLHVHSGVSGSHLHTQNSLYGFHFTAVTVISVLNLCPQASLWSVTGLWLAQSILAFLRLYHSHSQHISGPCRPREKELLLGHSLSDSGSPSPPPATPTVLV